MQSKLAYIALCNVIHSQLLASSKKAMEWKKDQRRKEKPRVYFDVCHDNIRIHSLLSIHLKSEDNETVKKLTRDMPLTANSWPKTKNDC